MIKVLEEEISFVNLQKNQDPCNDASNNTKEACNSCKTGNKEPGCSTENTCCTWNCVLFPGGPYWPNFAGGSCLSSCTTQNVACETDPNDPNTVKTKGITYGKCKGKCAVPANPADICGGSAGTKRWECEDIRACPTTSTTWTSCTYTESHQN